MAERRNPQTVISAEDILRTEIMISQALIDILIAKQIITGEELLTSIKNIKQEQKKLVGSAKKIIPLK